VAGAVGSDVNRPLLVLVDVVAWGVIHAATGYLVHRLPARRFERETWLTRPRRFEGDGHLYVRVFRIKRWKGWLPEAGALFAGGFDKKRLAERSDAYFATYVRETRRAELGHWLAAAAAPLFAFWNPWWVAVIMVAYAIVANGPCVLSQRYNRLRLRRILRRRAASSG
jgi:glycosyl-4,4'-diaponeurosporenoate acyltransferase